MREIIKVFIKGFSDGAIKSVDIGDTYHPRKIVLTRGENIKKSWENTGSSIRKSIKEVANAGQVCAEK